MPPHKLVFESPDDAMAAVYINKTPLERLCVAFGLWTGRHFPSLFSRHLDGSGVQARAGLAFRF